MLTMMTLAEYLRTTKTRQEDFASGIGVTQATISRFVRGIAVPSLELAAQIKAATNGAVTFEAWVSSKGNSTLNQETPHDPSQSDASSDAA